ncbi:MAG: phenylalanine--tRNA ligase beta subunit-related protein [Odoribacter sp.]|nr:phenylalanine--tRNA ligase beta subunit-related protein [Odoribacter sp.]
MNAIDFEIEPIVSAAAPQLAVVVLEASVTNDPTDDDLWQEITDVASVLRESTPMELVNKQPAIAATRAAYKALGKEPNRYRPSAEALCRRCVKGLDLYRSLSVIDLINMMSLVTGHSIGGFDLDKIEGQVLRLGRGRAGEPYEAIGRGVLNIEGLPVIRDNVGGIGTPTSDNERTKLSQSTKRLLMTINMYSGSEGAEKVVDLAIRLLSKYASATDIYYKIYGNT